MDIVIIGAGNVATHIAMALKKTYNIISVFSRQIKNAEQLAKKTASKAIDKTEDLPTDADLYIISVKDDAIENVVKAMPAVNGIVVHTAGSISIDTLSKFASYGVLYPFQTFSKEKDIDMNNVPVMIEGNNDEVLQKLDRAARSISEKIYTVNSQERLMLHISAVFACNFVNHFYHIASSLLEKAGLPFELLLPLIDETAMKVHAISPFDAQTGPASRNDLNTIQKHIDILKKAGENYPADIYSRISKHITELHTHRQKK